MNEWQKRAEEALKASLYPVPQEPNELDWKSGFPMTQKSWHITYLLFQTAKMEGSSTSELKTMERF